MKLERWSFCSPEFEKAVREAVNSEKRVLATIPVFPLPFLEGIKSRPDVAIFQLFYNNREEVYQKIKREFH